MNTEDKIAVMRAFERGETIEVSVIARDEFTKTLFPKWNWELYQYRVKAKEPREFYVIVDVNGLPSVAAGPDSVFGLANGQKLIKVREIL